MPNSEIPSIKNVLLQVAGQSGSRKMSSEATHKSTVRNTMKRATEDRIEAIVMIVVKMNWSERIISIAQ